MYEYVNEAIKLFFGRKALIIISIYVQLIYDFKVDLF